jgi:hypothetical protein
MLSWVMSACLSVESRSARNSAEIASVSLPCVLYFRSPCEALETARTRWACLEPGAVLRLFKLAVSRRLEAVTHER